MENKVLKIELGGGENPIKNGFLNVDARPLPTVDIIADIRDLPFENESVDEIFSTAVLEHFNFEDVKKILRESFRILKIGGKIEIIVPDLEEIIKRYVKGEIDWENFNMWIYGAQKYSYDLHKSCWDFKNFEDIMKNIGFSKIQKVSYSLGRDYVECPMLQIIAYKEKKCPYTKKIKNPVYNKDISYYKKISGEKNGISERIVPHIEEKLNYLFHLKRYYFALPYVRNKNVIDIGCGTGYGSFLLSQSAKYVIGIDNSQDTIEFANQHYKKENLEFIQMDWKKMRNLGKRFDAVISFEFIEHIKEVEEFLELIKEVLKENGVIIISTPNRSISSNVNPFHYREFNYYEFEEVLSKCFKNYIIYGEFLRMKSKMEIENIENIVKIIVKIIESHSRYINIIRKILLPLRYLRSKILFKKGLEKFDVWTFENKIFQKLFSLEDILITSSQTDIWKSDYLIGVIFFT